MTCSNWYMHLSDQELKLSAFRRLNEHLKDTFYQRKWSNFVIKQIFALKNTLNKIKTVVESTTNKIEQMEDSVSLERGCLKINMGISVSGKLGINGIPAPHPLSTRLMDHGRRWEIGPVKAQGCEDGNHCLLNYTGQSHSWLSSHGWLQKTHRELRDATP